MFEVYSIQPCLWQGRSGTLLVSYLLSLPELPPPPKEEGPGLEDSTVQKTKDKLKENVKHQTHDAAEHDEHDEHEEEEDALSEHVGVDTSEDETTLEQPTPHIPAEAMPDGAPLQQTKTHVEPVSTPVPDQPKHSYTPIAIGDEDPVDAPGQQDRKDGKLDAIFAFHSSRRMKPSTTKARRGVSIASRKYSTLPC